MQTYRNGLLIGLISLFSSIALANNDYDYNNNAYYTPSPIPVAVAPSQTLNDGWHYEIAPYLWMSGLSGDVTVLGVTQNVHITFSDILKNLNFAIQGHIEAGYGPWSFMIDPTYLKVSKDFTSDSIPVNTTVQNILIDSGIFLRVFVAPGISDGSISSFELLGGSRYFGIKSTLDADSIFSLSQKETSLSPIIGGRFKYYFTSKTLFWLRGDIGGFNVDGMKDTWSIISGLAYTIHKHIDIGIAYRVLKINYAKNADEFALNTLMYGPMIGFSLHN